MTHNEKLTRLLPLPLPPLCPQGLWMATKIFEQRHSDESKKILTVNRIGIIDESSSVCAILP